MQSLQTASVVGDVSYIASYCFLANFPYLSERLSLPKAVHFHLRPFTLAHSFRPLKFSQTKCYSFKPPDLWPMMRHNYRAIPFAFEQSLIISRHYTNDRRSLRAHLQSLAHVRIYPCSDIGTPKCVRLYIRGLCMIRRCVNEVSFTLFL